MTEYYLGQMHFDHLFHNGTEVEQQTKWEDLIRAMEVGGSPSSGNLDGNCPSNPTSRFPHQLFSNYQNQNNKKKNKKKKNFTQVNEERVIEAYQNFISEMNDKAYQANISENRFMELSTNPQTDRFDEKSIFEAEGGLQSEVDGSYSNLRRPDNPKVDLDFEATSVQTGKTIFVDHKKMIDFASLADKGI